MSADLDPRLDVLATDYAVVSGGKGYMNIDDYPVALGLLAALDAADPLRRALDPANPEHATLVEQLAPIAGLAAAREFLAALRDLA